jgi:hypothetical protein
MLGTNPLLVMLAGQSGPKGGSIQNPEPICEPCYDTKPRESDMKDALSGGSVYL